MKVIVILPFYLWLGAAKSKAGQSEESVSRVNNNDHKKLNMNSTGDSKVFLVKNGSAEQNVKKIIELLGGIEKFVEKNAIVILKPNAQRFNQGMTNTDAMKGFIDLVLEIPGFQGEIIIAENHQYQKNECCGWVTKQRNGQFNLNELVMHYQDKGYPNVTKYHWHVAGPCSYPLEGDGQGDNRVKGPEDGDGYVWLEDIFYVSPTGRKCLMTYPIFTSAYSGIRIDLKNGAWEDGRYINRPLRFINFATLNHHSRYAGVSASVKNLMGVVDMTCGFPGDLPQETYNTHHIGVSKLKYWLHHGHWRIRNYRGELRHLFENWCYRNFHHTGGVLGYFMTHVKRPDLNIIAADLVGWGDRKKLDKAFRPKAILAGTDPVALDYVAAREVLLPGTPEDAIEVSGVRYKELNNPDAEDSVFFKFLAETKKQGIGTLDLKKINVVRYEFF
ncbi:MAG: DUF362 domain-containing protein [Desulfobacteraceae bacterium]|nr:DUF362 domain-containing protein [Desulfobacteraceae bacterium]